ncbi:MAG: hypothetical protein RLZZ312_1184 [Bacteroidota bacterium]
MKKIIALLLISYSTFAQIKGVVTDSKNIPLARVSVFIQNTYIGTSTNDLGQYELNYKKTDKVTLIFQSIGYQTKKIVLSPSSFPLLQNIQLENEDLQLVELKINTKENPAVAVIKKAIANRKSNSEKTSKFTADFYSRGIFKLKDAPKKILGQKIGDFNGALDSTGSGIIYLSETVSKISFQKPDKLKERIIASKVSGKDNGFSYNTALQTSYDFYDNTVEFAQEMISPIADNALNYYKYKLEGTFQDENNQMINKIKVDVRRDAEPVFEGYIYIVEDSWAIYAVDLTIKGYRMKEDFLETLQLKQNFSFNKSVRIWSKNSQSLDVSAGAFGIKFNGKFNYVYSNYDFKESFEKKTFGNEIVSFEENANKKDNTFWATNRPIPLTTEESRDYVRKDSIKTRRESRPYLDSIDAKENKFKWHSPITGISKKNSFDKNEFKYDGLLGLSSLSFNTVQGWNLDSGFSYRDWSKNETEGKYWQIKTVLNYGFAEQRLRGIIGFYNKFNNQNYAYINVGGGSLISQFNGNNPISQFVNTVSTLFFKDNYAKFYNNEYLTTQYGQDVANGINVVSSLTYMQRKPLFNNTDYVTIKNDKPYLSNNPLDPNSDLLPAFEPHQIAKFTILGKFTFSNKYISRPDRKLNIGDDKYPTIFIGYENAFAASNKNLNYQFASARIRYDLILGNKGEIATNFKAGKFWNAQNISFIDYKHFNGNQTRIGTTDQYLNVFNLLPYYANSTNDAYTEWHTEYNDKGFLMNKIPLLNLLKTNLILGYHNLAVPNRLPYQEFSIGLDNIGFGKFKLLRLDYVRSYQNGVGANGIVFGLKFLNIITD